VTSHLLLLAVFAALVSSVFAALMKDDPRAQLKTGGWMFAAFLGVAIVLGWLMYPLPL
jgi:heme A synthase